MSLSVLNSLDLNALVDSCKPSGLQVVADTERIGFVDHATNKPIVLFQTGEAFVAFVREHTTFAEVASKLSAIRSEMAVAKPVK